MTDIYLVRHGQSETNVVDIFAGHLDSPLCETGKKQAELLKNYFKNIKIDKIYSSDLSRAYNTILPTAKEHGLEIIKRKELREIYAGEWEGATFDLLIGKYEKDYSLWRTDVSKAFFTGGESVPELAERIKNEFDEIAKTNDGKAVVIATHATPVRALISLIQTGGLDGMQSLGWVPNASVSHIIYENGKFDFLTVAETDHLEGLTTNLS